MALKWVRGRDRDSISQIIGVAVRYLFFFARCRLRLRLALWTKACNNWRVDQPYLLAYELGRVPDWQTLGFLFSSFFRESWEGGCELVLSICFVVRRKK